MSSRKSGQPSLKRNAAANYAAQLFTVVAGIVMAFVSVFALLAIAGRNAGLLLLILSGLAISSLAGAATALVNQFPSLLRLGVRWSGKTEPLRGEQPFDVLGPGPT